jgi:hypothetical protein
MCADPHDAASSAAKASLDGRAARIAMPVGK